MCGEWQFVSGGVEANGAYATAEFSLVYDYNANGVYFDGLQLFQEQFDYTYTYDSSGRMTKVKDLAGNETTYTYRGSSADLASVTAGDRNTVQYTYDTEKGTLSSVTDARGATVTNSYDVMRRLTSTGTGSAILSYTYANDRVSTLTHPGTI